jgi:hypothetical protein
MQYIYSICNSLIKWANKSHSSTIIVPAVRDLFIYLESSLLQEAMIKTANEKENLNIKDLMDSLKETDRDIQSIINNIEYLRDNLGMPVNDEQEYKTACLVADRLSQLRDEAVVVKDYPLAKEIDDIFENIF